MDKNLSSTCTTILGYGIGFVLLMVYSYMTSGLVLSSLWNWFVSPTLNVPMLSMIQAIGLSMVAGYFKGIELKNDKEKSQNTTANIVTALIYPWIVLFFGWIFHYLFFAK